MQGRIICNCILVTTLLGSHAVFANPDAGNQQKILQETAGHVATGIEAEAVATNFLNIFNYDNHEEIVQRIITDARQELSRWLDASSLGLEALEFSESYLKISISNTTGKLNLTAR